MKILIVHDREQVAIQINEIISQTCDDAPDVTTLIDARTARNALETNLFDLVILDLTIPFNADRSPIDYRAASDILEEIFLMGTLTPPGDIIGITKDSDALSNIGTTVGEHLMAIVDEDDAGIWKKQLADKIKYCSLVSSRRQISMISHYDYDVLIITALDEEALPYNDLIEIEDYPFYAGAKEFIVSDQYGKNRRGILFSIGKSGQASAASASQSLVSFFRPRLAILTGFCGGVEGKANKGDIVFFESAYDWDYGKWYSEEADRDAPSQTQFYSRPNPVSAGGESTRRVIREFLLREPRNELRNFNSEVQALMSEEKANVKMKFAAAASGSAVVGSTDIVNRIRMLNDDIKAIDMEAYGFYHACTNTRVIKPDFLCVKAVADYADGTKDDRYHSICSSFSARIAMDFIRSHWSF